MTSRSTPGLGWLLRGELVLRPWLLLALLATTSSLAGGTVWLLLRVRVQQAQIQTLEHGLGAVLAGGRP